MSNNTLLLINDPKICRYFAQWGYNTDDQKEIAKNNNIQIVDHKNFLSEILDL